MERNAGHRTGDPALAELAAKIVKEMDDKPCAAGVSRQEPLRGDRAPEGAAARLTGGVARRVNQPLGRGMDQALRRAGRHRWNPQVGPQNAFVAANVFPRSSTAGRAAAARPTRRWATSPAARGRLRAPAAGLLVRRARVALEPTISRARQIYGPAGAEWVESQVRASPGRAARCSIFATWTATPTPTSIRATAIPGSMWRS